MALLSPDRAQYVPPPPWMAMLEGIPITPHMQQLQDELIKIEQKQFQVVRDFHRNEDLFSEEITDLEAQFGKELERMRRADMQQKQKLRAEVDAQKQAVQLGREVGTHHSEDEGWDMEQEVEHSERRLMAAYEERERILTDEHRRRMEALQTELQEAQAMQNYVETDLGAPWMGVDLADTQGHGVRVSRVIEAAPAAVSGLIEGDIITQIQASRNITGKGHFNKLAHAVRRGDKLAILVEREGAEYEIVLEI